MIVWLNGHGAPNHQRTLQRSAVEEAALPRVRALYLTAWQPPQPPRSDPGYAERWETEIVLALDESPVRLDRLPARGQPIRYQDYGTVDGRAFDGAPSPNFLLPRVADPREAGRAQGERLLDGEISGVAANARRHLNEVLRLPLM